MAAGVNLSTPRIIAKAADSPKAPQTIKAPWLSQSWNSISQFGYGSSHMNAVRPVYAAPDKLSDKVADSVKNAEEACEGDPASGDCVAAWDEVEELSAAASHARDKLKESDPLENYCKDNPETDECRTYDN